MLVKIVDIHSLDAYFVHKEHLIGAIGNFESAHATSETGYVSGFFVPTVLPDLMFQVNVTLKRPMTFRNVAIESMTIIGDPTIEGDAPDAKVTAKHDVVLDVEKPILGKPKNAGTKAKGKVDQKKVTPKPKKGK